MTLKKIGYINDPFRYVDCFKLTCYTNICCTVGDWDGDILTEKSLYFDNTSEILPYIEELVKLEKQLKAWKKWIEDIHPEEEYKKVWNGKERDIIPKFQEIYNKIQNKAIEQFRYVSIMKLIDFGFTIKYIDKDGYENNLEVV